MLFAIADNIADVSTRMHDINITKTPLNPFDLIITNKWHVCTFSLFEQILGMTSEEMKEQISPRAFSFYSSATDTYCLIYNSELDEEHIYFNLAHEIGHIFYKHVSPESALLGKRDSGKSERDNQADQFAHFLLQR